MNEEEIDFAKFSISEWTNEVRFKTKSGDGFVTVAREALGTIVNSMTGAQWARLDNGISELGWRLPPQRSTLTNTPIPGWKHPVFGRMVSGNKAEKTVEFEKATITMEQVLIEINALYQGGVINAADLQKLSTVPQQEQKAWDSSDALLLITEEIRHATEPRKAASEWLSKFTIEVSTIIAEVDDGS